jgi:RimJ/RimL family protein N-acetyltransferase
MPAVTGEAIAVELRAVEPRDLDAHFEQQRDPASSRLAAVPARDRAAFDAHWARILADPATVVRTVVADGAVAGSAVSFLRDGRRWVGYWIGREHWGRGVGSAALAALLGELPERPLYATVAEHNGASRRILEKAGFVPVGEQRDGGVRLLVLRLD